MTLGRESLENTPTPTPSIPCTTRVRRVVQDSRARFPCNIGAFHIAQIKVPIPYTTRV